MNRFAWQVGSSGSSCGHVCRIVRPSGVQLIICLGIEDLNLRWVCAVFAKLGLNCFNITQNDKFGTIQLENFRCRFDNTIIIALWQDDCANIFFRSGNDLFEEIRHSTFAFK